MKRSFPDGDDHSLIGNEIQKQTVSIQYGKDYGKITLRNSKLSPGMIPRESDADPCSSQEVRRELYARKTE